jgi:hypothetical protein
MRRNCKTAFEFLKLVYEFDLEVANWPRQVSFNRIWLVTADNVQWSYKILYKFLVSPMLKNYVLNIYGVVEARLHAFFTLALNGGKWSASCSGTHWIRKFGGTQGQSGSGGEEKTSGHCWGYNPSHTACNLVLSCFISNHIFTWFQLCYCYVPYQLTFSTMLLPYWFRIFSPTSSACLYIRWNIRTVQQNILT